MIQFAEGDFYVGNFKNFEFHGIGKYFRQNGDLIKGDFKNDLAHG